MQSVKPLFNHIQEDFSTLVSGDYSNRFQFIAKIN